MAEATMDQKTLLAKDLKRFLPEISGVAVKQIDPQRIMRLVAECCEKNPLLYQCSRKSLLVAAFQSAECGLEVGSAMNHAYIVPRKISNEWVAIFTPSAYGLAELAYRSGLVKAIWWEPVFEGDEFAVMGGDDPHIRHISNEEHDDYEHLTHVYAVAELMTGGKIRRVLTKKQIEKRKMMNDAVKSGKFSPWTNWAVEMACVKALRAICGRLPRSKELSQAMSFVDADETGKPELAETEFKALPESNILTRADRVAQRLGVEVEQVVTPPTDAAEREIAEQEAML